MCCSAIIDACPLRSKPSSSRVDPVPAGELTAKLLSSLPTIEHSK
jgi:hypothetical protein